MSYPSIATCPCFTLHCFCSVYFECLSRLFVGISWKTEQNFLPFHWYLFYFSDRNCL